MRSTNILRAFRKGQLVRDATVDDLVRVDAGLSCVSIHCEDCHFHALTAACEQINGPVRFTRCVFDSLEFYATYFHGGFIMEQCRVAGELVFQSGGHNGNSKPFVIRDMTFDSFVDFEDCWFTGPVRIQNVHFAGGTNLLGNKHTPLEVRFDLPPVLEDVRGQLNQTMP